MKERIELLVKLGLSEEQAIALCKGIAKNAFESGEQSVDFNNGEAEETYTFDVYWSHCLPETKE